VEQEGLGWGLGEQVAGGRWQVAGGRWPAARVAKLVSRLWSRWQQCWLPCWLLAAVLAVLAAGRWLYLWALNPPADGSKRAACEGDTPAATLRSRRWLEVEDRMRPPPKATKAPGTFHFSVTSATMELSHRACSLGGHM
jgi:hypothetical protein